jgi:hypothetical protein
MEIFILILPPILVIIGNVLQIMIQRHKLNHLRKELEGAKAIIKDTADLRNAIFHEIEGLWSLVGNFQKFQNIDAQHNSEGFLMLIWIPSKRHYDAIYCYSVSRAGENTALVTAICQGYSDGDLEYKKSFNISLKMRVVSRTDVNCQANFSKTFTLNLEVNRTQGTTYFNNMSSKFTTPLTIGTLAFSKES